MDEPLGNGADAAMKDLESGKQDGSDREAKIQRIKSKLYQETESIRHARRRVATVERAKFLICISELMAKISVRLGQVALAWGSTILLGGFVGGLTSYDFWVISALILANVVRLFGTRYRPKLTQNNRYTLVGYCFLNLSYLFVGIPVFFILVLLGLVTQLTGLKRRIIYSLLGSMKLLRQASPRIWRTDISSGHLVLWVLPFIEIGSALISLIYPILRLKKQDFGDTARQTKNLEDAMKLYYGMVLTEASLFVIATISSQLGVPSVLSTIENEPHYLASNADAAAGSQFEYLDTYPDVAIVRDPESSDDLKLLDKMDNDYLNEVYKIASQESVTQALDMNLRRYVFKQCEGTVKSVAEFGSAPNEELLFKRLSNLYYSHRDNNNNEEEFEMRMQLLKHVLDYISKQVLSRGYVREDSCIELAKNLVIGNFRVLLPITEEHSETVMLLCQLPRLKETVTDVLLLQLLEDDNEVALLVLARFCTRLGPEGTQKFLREDLKDMLLELVESDSVGAALVLHLSGNKDQVKDFIIRMKNQKRWSVLAPFLEVLDQEEIDALDVAEMLCLQFPPSWAVKWIPCMTKLKWEENLKQLKSKEVKKISDEWLELMVQLQWKDKFWIEFSDLLQKSLAHDA